MGGPDADHPVGPALPGWRPRPRPSRTPLEGSYCRLEPLEVDRHADPLFEAFQLDPAGLDWTYLPYGPFPDVGAHRRWVETVCTGEDPLFFAVLDSEGRPRGAASYLRIQPQVGSIEVGHIHYSPPLQRGRAATEAMYLMMRRAFDELGYRRYEWKCDALNAASRRAAERLGFTYEGTFRQATVYKGRNRDTAWYSIVDGEWPRIRIGLEAWLRPDNFDPQGVQLSRLRTRG